MSSYRHAMHGFMLCIIALVSLGGRWLQPSVALGQSAPTTALSRTQVNRPQEPAALQPFGYGVAVAEHDWTSVWNMGFNWMMVYDVPAARYPVNVLYRAKADYSVYEDYTNWFEQFQQLVLDHGNDIDAYEIGNEVNLTENGWAAPPNVYEYVPILCAAYAIIKEYDPTAIVVSAGLAPVGRVTGNWAGHQGHNGQQQDEREFLREFFQIGGGACTDVIGYHPTGFSANYDAELDVHTADPATNCDNGFCFRAAEKMHDIMQAYGYGHERIWATEMGWLAEPDNPACLQDPTWQGRAWQRVTRTKQTENLTGAFHYAREHWPWMAAMFVFNLNFSQAPWYQACEQMRFYSIHNTAASTALAQLHLKYTYLPMISHR